MANDLPPRLLRMKDVIARTGRSRSSIYADKTFIVPVKVGQRGRAYLESEVNSWIEARAAERFQ